MRKLLNFSPSLRCPWKNANSFFVLTVGMLRFNICTNSVQTNLLLLKRAIAVYLDPNANPEEDQLQRDLLQIASKYFGCGLLPNVTDNARTGKNRTYGKRPRGQNKKASRDKILDASLEYPSPIHSLSIDAGGL